MVLFIYICQSSCCWWWWGI